MIKVCHLTSVHRSHDVRILHKECASLARAGFDTYLLAVNASSEVVKNVKIIGIEAPRGGRIKRMTATASAVYHKALEIDADIYHFHDPELLTVGWRLRRKGKKVIYDAHEDLPRQLYTKPYIKEQLRGTVSWVMERVENFLASRMTGIVTATPVIRDRFLKINKSTIDINNFPDLVESNELPLWSARKAEICYIGGIFRQRGATELVDALEYCNVKLNLAGNYSPTNYRDELTARKGWSKVNEYGFVGRLQVQEILGRSIAGTVTLHPMQSYMDSLPVKMFEYMAAGIPVIASNFPLWRSIIRENNCGVCVDPLDPTAIAAAVNKLLDDPALAEQMGKNGRKAVEEIYNWEKEEMKLVSFYKRIAAS
jgi:glycosyltransferase involved in cell wall biosynthesis